jgi:hypothetical protein
MEREALVLDQREGKVSSKKLETWFLWSKEA